MKPEHFNGRACRERATIVPRPVRCRGQSTERACRGHGRPIPAALTGGHLHAPDARRPRSRIIPAIGAAAAVLWLAGCSDDHATLRGWMEEVRASTRPVRETIAEPKRFEPFRYERGGEADPFAPSRLAGLVLEAQPAAAQPRGGLQPDLSRPREALERYPLDAIRMVGHLSNDRQSFALLQVDGIVHQVRVGNFVGQDFGVIMRVEENEIVLRELVQDAAGDWVHRETSLRLQEENY